MSVIVFPFWGGGGDHRDLAGLDADDQHPIGAVTGLPAALDAKAATSHGHPANAISDATEAGRSVLTAADAAAQRTALGLGTAATKNTGTSGDAVPLLNASNTWSARQYITQLPLKLTTSVASYTVPDYPFGTYFPAVVANDASAFMISAANSARMSTNSYRENASLKYRGGGATRAAELIVSGNNFRYARSPNAPEAGATVADFADVFLVDSAATRPGVDNTSTCGAASYRWSVVYAASGTINTSDAREKTAVAALTAPELAAAKALTTEVGTYKFLASVADKGDAARLHIGLTVQRAIEIMEQHGLDPMRYGFICYDAWDESVDEVTGVVQPAGDRYSFRYDELALFILRGLHARLDVLEAML